MSTYWVIQMHLGHRRVCGLDLDFNMIKEFTFGPFWQEVPQVRGVHWRAKMTFDILTDLKPTLEVSMFEKMHHNSPSANVTWMSNKCVEGIHSKCKCVSVFPPLQSHMHYFSDSEWIYCPSCHICCCLFSVFDSSQSVF